MKFFRFSLLAFILLLPATRAFAQQKTTIRALVTDIHHRSIAVDAQLLSLPDSAFVQGATFPDGRVLFSIPEQKNAVLKLSSLAFKDKLMPFYEMFSLHDLGTIVMEEQDFALQEVQIRSQAPLVRQGVNGSVEVQVSGTILAGSTSVNQILERSPGITFTDGRVQVIGKGEALIFLNGQAITYERMRTIPVSQIVRIEIISNPSSRYDAEGKAVVRIITRSNPEKGITGTITQQYTHSRFAGGEGNTLTDLNVRRNKLTLAANYTLRTGNEREILYTTRSRPDAAISLRSELMTDWQRKLRNYSNYGIGAQYNISERTYISLGYKGNFDHLGGNQYSQNRIADAVSTGDYNSTLAKNEKRLNHSLIFNYNQNLDSLGSSFFVGSQLARFHTDIHDAISENNMRGDSAFSRLLKNDQLSAITIFSAQIDYSKAFANHKKLEAGAKVSYATTSSDTDFMLARQDGIFANDPGLSSQFDYREWVPAAYANYSGSIGRNLRFGVGARAEWTNYRLNTTAGAGILITRSYFNVFPNVYLSRTIASELELRASYTAKITRPRYQALNPFVIYQDPFTTIEGNPGLQPEKVHSFEVGAGYKQWNVRAAYNYTRDPISGAALRGDGPNNYVLKGINLKQDHTLLVSASAVLTIGWWNTTNTLTVSRSNTIDDQYGFELVKPRPQVYAYSNNTFNVRDIFRIQLLAWYLGAKYYGLYYNESRATVTVGIEKDFLKNTLKLRLTANDIFHQTNASGTYSVGQTDIYFDRTYSTSYFNIALTYRFGKPFKNTFRSKAAGEAEQGRAR